MIAVLIIRNKPDKPAIKNNDGAFASRKMTVHREIVNILLFNDTAEFHAWMRAEWQERYPDFDFEVHGIEDMRQSLSSSMPKCRHCKWYPKDGRNAIRLYCRHPDYLGVVVNDHTSGCSYFEEGTLEYER